MKNQDGSPIIAIKAAILVSLLRGYFFLEVFFTAFFFAAFFFAATVFTSVLIWIVMNGLAQGSRSG
jgi:hypothetical protein